MQFLSLFLMALTVLFGAVQAKSNHTAVTHYYNWTTSWGTASPDGYERKVITCNGEYPWPDIRVHKGDRVVLTLNNGLDNQNTSCHFHGLFQHKTNQFDGVPQVSQCDIAPGSSMTYNFTVEDQAGSYWYHSHSQGQYMDGFRGSFIIEDDSYPFDFDEDVIIRITEWYHELVDDLVPPFMNVYNPSGAEPIPYCNLLNDTLNGTVSVKPDTTYLFRIINQGGFVSQYFWIEDHTFTIVAVDGVYVEPNETEYLYITVAQRYDVLVHTKNDTSRNYALMVSMDQDMLDTPEDCAFANTTSQFMYNPKADNASEIDDNTEYIDELFDDFYLKPLDAVELYEDYDYQIKIDVVMDNLNDGINYAFFNNITYVAPKVPVLGTVFSSGNLSTNDQIYGDNTHAFVLDKDEVVEIVVNNNDTGKHPFHLHGHVFQIVERGPAYPDTEGYTPVPWNESAPYTPPDYPSMRDTLYVRAQSYFRIRFKADNPGVWIFHCHIEWHLVQGLAIILVEDPESINAQEKPTENWKQVCEDNDTPWEGNAAANTKDFLDLTGQNVQVKFLPSGFTARGIVALVFSCIAAFLGMAAICYYGMSDIPNLNEQVMGDLDVTPDELDEDADTEGKSSSKDSSKSDVGAAGATGTSKKHSGIFSRLSHESVQSNTSHTSNTSHKSTEKDEKKDLGSSKPLAANADEDDVIVQN